jgi:hypothetical protein
MAIDSFRLTQMALGEVSPGLRMGRRAKLELLSDLSWSEQSEISEHDESTNPGAGLELLDLRSLLGFG